MNIYRQEPIISVIIPTIRLDLNFYSDLDEILRQVSGNSAEVIIVVDGLVDSLESLKQRYSGYGNFIVKVHETRLGRASARNSGAEIASGEFLLFVDADCVPHRDWFSCFLDAVSTSSDVYMGVRVESNSIIESPVHIWENSMNEIWSRDLRALDSSTGLPPYFGQVPWIYGYTHSLMIRRSTFESVEGFDAGFGLTWGWEDVDLSFRIYLEYGPDVFRFLPEALTYHRPSHRDPFDWWRQSSTSLEYATSKHWRRFEWSLILPTSNVEYISQRIVGISNTIATLPLTPLNIQQEVQGILADRGLLSASSCVIGKALESDLFADFRAFADFSREPVGDNSHIVYLIPDHFGEGAGGDFGALICFDYWMHLRPLELSLLLNNAFRRFSTVLLAAQRSSPLDSYAQILLDFGLECSVEESPLIDGGVLLILSNWSE